MHVMCQSARRQFLHHRPEIMGSCLSDRSLQLGRDGDLSHSALVRSRCQCKFGPAVSKQYDCLGSDSVIDSTYGGILQVCSKLNCPPSLLSLLSLDFGYY